MPRLTFYQVFKQLDPNTLQVLRKIKVGSIELDEGATITKGTLVGGLDLFKYVTLSAELEGDQIGDVWVLRKIIYSEV